VIPSLIPYKLDPYIKEVVTEFALANEDLFIWNHSNTEQKLRRYCDLNKVKTDISDIVEEYSQELYKRLNMTTTLTEPMFGNFVGVNFSGGSVHSHTDPTIDGYNHVRLNFLVSKPSSGGMPIINDKEYSIDENLGWVNLANKYRHASTVVAGTTPRILLSLGKYVIKEESDHYENLYR
jgi:hypothetical protein